MYEVKIYNITDKSPVLVWEVEPIEADSLSELAAKLTELDGGKEWTVKGKELTAGDGAFKAEVTKLEE